MSPAHTPEASIELKELKKKKKRIITEVGICLIHYSEIWNPIYATIESNLGFFITREVINVGLQKID